MTDESRAAREDRIQENIQAKKAAAPAASSAGNSKAMIYIGRQESGEVEYFTDELEAHRFAIKGAKCSVEPRAPLGRTKRTN